MLKSDLRLSILLTLLPVDIGIAGQFNIDMAIALIMGLSLRFSFNWHRTSLTLKDSLIRLICALGVSFIILTVRNDYFKSHNPVVAIFFSSMISLEIVTEFINVTQVGFKKWIAQKITSLIGKND